MVPSDCTAHPAGITGRVSCSQVSHRVLWLQRCKDAKRQRAKGAARAGRKGAALYPTLLYTSPLRVKDSARARSIAGWSACCNGQITVVGSAVSPSWPGYEQNRLVKQAGGWDI